MRRYAGVAVRSPQQEMRDVDLGSERGRELVKQLAAKCDIIVENFRPGTLEKWGLSYEELKKLNPGAILVRISAYGQDGPMRSQPGFARACIFRPDLSRRRTRRRSGGSWLDLVGRLYVGHVRRHRRTCRAAVPRGERRGTMYRSRALRIGVSLALRDPPTLPKVRLCPPAHCRL